MEWLLPGAFWVALTGAYAGWNPGCETLTAPGADRAAGGRPRDGAPV